MICPLCKKGRLARRRTYDQGERVLRESRCMKCHAYTKTIEFTDQAYQAERRQYEQHAQDLAAIIEQREGTLLNVQEALRSLLPLALGPELLDKLQNLKAGPRRRSTKPSRKQSKTKSVR